MLSQIGFFLLSAAAFPLLFANLPTSNADDNTTATTEVAAVTTSVFSTLDPKLYSLGTAAPEPGENKQDRPSTIKCCMCEVQALNTICTGTKFCEWKCQYAVYGSVGYPLSQLWNCLRKGVWPIDLKDDRSTDGWLSNADRIKVSVSYFTGLHLDSAMACTYNYCNCKTGPKSREDGNTTGDAPPSPLSHFGFGSGVYGLPPPLVLSLLLLNTLHLRLRP